MFSLDMLIVLIVATLIHLLTKHPGKLTRRKVPIHTSARQYTVCVTPPPECRLNKLYGASSESF